MVDAIRALTFVVVALLFPFYGETFAKETRQKKPRPRTSNLRPTGRATASLDGLKLSYIPRPVYTKKALRNQSYDSIAEIDAIVGSRAVVETTRPIGYRNTVLAPGRYDLQIGRNGSKFHFVISPVKTAGKRSRSAKKTEMGVAGVLRRGGTGPRRKGDLGKQRGPAKTSHARKRARDAGEVLVESQKSPTSQIIRAAFRLRNNPRPTPSVTYALRLSRDKKKFELRVSAGTSTGRANVSFVGAKRRNETAGEGNSPLYRRSISR